VKIVVTTPTGHVGSRVARVLIQAGARLTLLARHPRGSTGPLASKRMSLMLI